MQHGGKRAGAGRKPAKIDLGELEHLCVLQCTDEELAGFFNVTVWTIERRRQSDPAFAAAMERGRAKGRISVRRGLHLQAAQGKTQALIFLSKSLLDSRARCGSEQPVANAGSNVPKVKSSPRHEDLLKLYREIAYGDPPATESALPGSAPVSNNFDLANQKGAAK
jgi:hypothetical protein